MTTIHHSVLLRSQAKLAHETIANFKKEYNMAEWFKPL
jgi:hypothetical protein